MRISEIAYKKISATAMFISDIAAREVECMGYLLAKKGSSTVTDFFFPQQEGLEARSGTSDFPYTGMHEKGMSIAGMWHSHGSFPLFHSGIDCMHIENKLRAIARENKLLDSWQAYPIENAISMFNSETMQGFKIVLKEKAYAIPEIKANELLKVHEIFPKEFYSIVVNKDTYRKGKQCHAMRFFLLNNELLKAEEQVEIIPGLESKTLEKIAEKFSCDGIALKDMKAYKALNAVKAKQENNIVNLSCKKGNFSLECRTQEQAVELSESIKEIKELKEQEKEELKKNIPKQPSADKRLESMLGNKAAIKEGIEESVEKTIEKERMQEAIKTEAIPKATAPASYSKPISDYLSGAMELHALQARKFISLAPYYTKAELDAEKAIVDIFAALSGVFDSSESRKENLKTRAEIIKGLLRKTRCFDRFAKEILKKADEIIQDGEYTGEEKQMIAELIKKAGVDENA
ncbi:MAG: hypothetical protein V1734_04810 [Nanoarchaeota archaeon]